MDAHGELLEEENKRFFTKEQIQEVKDKIVRPNYKRLFNPFQRDTQNPDLAYSGRIGFIADAIQRNIVVTLLAGYHGLRKTEAIIDILPYLSPNFCIMLFPKYAIKPTQMHFGLGTYLTNPLAPLATGLAIARTDANKLSKYCKRYLGDETINRYDVASALLLVPTIPLAIAAIIIDVVKMLVTYAVLLPIMALTAPITLSLAARSMKNRYLHDDSVYHRVEDDARYGGDDHLYTEHAVDL